MGKLPINPATGGLASSTDPTTWTGYAEAMARLHNSANLHGVGIVLGAGLSGIDLDNCIDDRGRIHPAAQGIIDRLDSYAEVSQSGRGVKILLRGWKPDNRRSKTDKTPWGGAIEIYDRGRFFALTGNRLDGTPQTLPDRENELAAVYRQFMPSPTGRIDRPAPTAPAITTDLELLAMAAAARNGAKFSALYAGRWQSTHGSQSEADLALCVMLSFWTNRDAGRIDRLFRGSGLMRDKWDEKHAGDGRTYGAMTVDRAIDLCSETYTPPTSGGDGDATAERLKAWRDGRVARARAAIHALDWPELMGGARPARGCLAVMDALLDLAATAGRFTVRVSLRTLALRSGKAEPSTALRILERLRDAKLIDFETGANGCKIRIDEPTLSVLGATLLDHTTRGSVAPSTQSRHKVYSANRGDDPYLTGTSRWAKKHLDRPDDDAELREWLAATKGLGELSLRVIDLLHDGAQLTAAGMAEILHANVRTTERTVARLAELDLLSAVDVEDTGGRPATRYALAADWQERVQELRPTLRTHMLAAERHERAEAARVDAHARTDALIKAGVHTERADQAAERRDRRDHAIRQRAAWLQVLDADLSAEDALRLAAAPRSARVRSLSTRLAARRLSEARQSINKARSFRRERVSKETAQGRFEYAGYDRHFAAAVVDAAYTEPLPV